MTAPPAVVRLSEAAFDALGQGATMVVSEPAVFRVEGPGAVPCLQGVVTADVAGPGPDTAGIAALLTPKGMIVVDLLYLRQAGGFQLILARDGQAAAAAVLGKLLPPRLARSTDLTGQHTALWLLGPEAEPVARSAGLPWPVGPGRLTGVPTDAGPVVLATPPSAAPWSALVVGPPEAVGAVQDRLERSGARLGGADELEAARILAGWPALGREIDDRTLPQEVRLDELGGVSYTKGCYVGQETVARVHFRGHVNRLLRGLTWSGGTPPETGELVAGGKVVGRLASVLQLPGRGLGLALIRREVEEQGEVELAGRRARVIRLPFGEALARGRPRLVTGD